MANRLTKQGSVTYIQAIPAVPDKPAYCTFTGQAGGVFPNFLNSTTAKSGYGQTANPNHGDRGFYYSPGANDAVISGDGTVRLGDEPYKLPIAFRPSS